MAISAGITLTSAEGDLTSSALSVSTSVSLTKTGTATAVEHTTGLARKVVKSTAKATANCRVDVNRSRSIKNK